MRQSSRPLSNTQNASGVSSSATQWSNLASVERKCASESEFSGIFRQSSAVFFDADAQVGSAHHRLRFFVSRITGRDREAIRVRADQARE